MAKVQTFEDLAPPACGHLCIAYLWLTFSGPSLRPSEGQQDVCKIVKPGDRAQSRILCETDSSCTVCEPAQTAHTVCVHMICMLLLGHILSCSSLHLQYLFMIAWRTLCTDGTAERWHSEQTWHYITWKNKHTCVYVCAGMYACMCTHIKVEFSDSCFSAFPFLPYWHPERSCH